MLKLFVNETEVQSAAVPISWCLDPDTLMNIKKRSVDTCSQPFLIIIIAPKQGYNQSKEIRQVVPLESMMDYLSFRVPGENNVFAFVSWHTSIKRAREALFERSTSWLSCSGFFSSEFLDTEGQEFNSNFMPAGYEQTSASITIDVPRDCFAKEPPAWEKAWVNWMHSHEAADQCVYRKRRLLAYFPLLQPLLFVGIMAFRILATLVLLGLTVRGINFRPLYRPLSFDTSDIRGDLKRPLFVPEMRKEWLEGLIAFGLIPFMPLVVLVATGITTCFCDGLCWWETILYGIGYTYIVMLIVIAVVAIVGGIVWLKDELPGHVRKKLKPIEEDDDKWLDLACCSQTVAPTRVADLPARRRTIRLRFLGLKAKVCQPFAG